MISKVFSSANFGRTCLYVYNKTGAVLLESRDLRNHSAKVMAEDFMLQAALRPRLAQACFHAVLSFPRGDEVTDKQMQEIGRAYLEELGMAETQYAIVRHTDTAHPHMHIIANRVTSDGGVISDKMIGLKAKKVAQKLSQAYGLAPVERKNLSPGPTSTLNASEQNRRWVQQAIATSLPQCSSLEMLIQRLKAQGIETTIKYRNGTTEAQGISFKIGVDCFKGSKVAREYSLANIQKAITAQCNSISKLRLQTESSNSRERVPDRSKIFEVPLNDFSPAIVLRMAEDWLKAALAPVPTSNQEPYELLQEARKKRKKKGRRL